MPCRFSTNSFKCEPYTTIWIVFSCLCCSECHSPRCENSLICSHQKPGPYLGGGFNPWNKEDNIILVKMDSSPQIVGAKINIYIYITYQIEPPPRYTLDTRNFPTNQIKFQVSVPSKGSAGRPPPSFGMEKDRETGRSRKAQHKKSTENMATP